MKEMFSSLFLILLLCILPALAIAQESAKTLTPTQSAQGLSEQIANLKEKIASRVAELQIVEKRGVVGEVTAIESTEITLSDLYGKTRLIDVDEITKFISDDKDFGISDITEGTILSILGRYNKDSGRLLARFIKVVSLPRFLNGDVTSVDRSGFSFVLSDLQNTKTTVDYETITRTQAYTQNKGLTKSGFSDIKEGDYVLVTGFPDTNNPSIIDATRILNLKNIRSLQKKD